MKFIQNPTVSHEEYMADIKKYADAKKPQYKKLEVDYSKAKELRAANFKEKHRT